MNDIALSFPETNAAAGLTPPQLHRAEWHHLRAREKQQAKLTARSRRDLERVERAHHRAEHQRLA